MSTAGKYIKKIVNLSPALKECSVRIYELLRRAAYLRYVIGTPIETKTVVFESYLGSSYACSPKALYEAMCADPAYSDYKKVWMFRNPQKYQFLEENTGTVVVKRGSGEYYRYYASAKIWITNYLPEYGIRKRPGQIYVQTWHGTPLKKIGCDVARKELSLAERKRTFQKYEREGKSIDYLPSPSAFYSEKISSAFLLGKQAEILQYGYPRNDALFQIKEEKIGEIRRKLGIPMGKKVILYAPTWRDNQHTPGIGYTYKPGLDFDDLREKIGGEYVLLFRAHYLISSRFDFGQYEGFVYNVSEYDDINDLYIAADMLITDYSSVFFDYAILKRPILFYMYDYEEYKEQMRDFYFEAEELPGPAIKEKRDISVDICRLMESFSYDEKYRNFNKKFNPVTTPCSSRILQKITGKI